MTGTIVLAAGDAIHLGPEVDLGILGDFIAEAREYLQASEAALLRLEVEPRDAEAINTIFRAFHTIKGTSAFLELSSVSDLAHIAENLLSDMRDRVCECTPARATLIFRAMDVMTSLIDRIARAMTGETAVIPAGYLEIIDALSHVQADSATPEDVPPVAAAPIATDVVAGTTTSHAESMVRVRTDRLDRLVDMVGELVIAHSMLAQDETVLRIGHHDLSRKVAHGGKIVRELQDLSMSMRMVPLKAAFQKVERLARDLAQRHGKLVSFVTDGEDTEIDRTLVEIISDPLVHMIRNAVDHGLETPADRVTAGKSEQGTIRLTASHSGGSVVVQLRDDGRGLNRERIVAKAIERGLIESADSLTQGEIDNLIFLPGFSTADTVTEVSGRGVGMDVVRRNVEAVRGRVDIASTPGQGTTFTVRVPLTLAITDAMLVAVGAQRYLVPTLHIRLSFRPEPSQLATIAGRGEIVLLRGEPIPILRLHRLFGVAGAVESPAAGLLIIVSDSTASAALLVDDLLGQQQVVAKSLGEAGGSNPGLGGGAILGDGRVGLILDGAALAGMARRGAGREP